MTNAEAATYFANLPPAEDAKVLLIDGDLCTAEMFDLELTAEEDLSDCDPDELDGDEVGKPYVFKKW